MRFALLAAAGTVLILPPGFTAVLIWLAWKISGMHISGWSRSSGRLELVI